MSDTDIWWDTALLDHSNPDTRKAMIEAMRFWVELGVDGFRLDHGCGDKIPLYLWEEARAALDPVRDLFWLAECGHKTFILDGSYADQFEVIMREVASGEKAADALAKWVEEDMFTYGRTAFRMTYTSNHDLNSWVGTTFERLGEGHKAFAALVFTAYGFPITIEENENVMAFMREIDGNRVIGIFNLSAENQSVEITEERAYGSYSDYFSGKEYDLNSRPVALKPWEFIVFAR